jgi:hypothetical protein
MQTRTDAPVEQRARLDQLEETIRRGRDAFLSVGAALLAVKREKLYRLEYPTFAAYCRRRWQFSAKYANRLVSAFNWSQECKRRGEPVPANERQARLAMAAARRPSPANPATPPAPPSAASRSTAAAQPPADSAPLERAAAAGGSRGVGRFGLAEAQAIVERIGQIRRLHSAIPEREQFDGMLDLYISELRTTMRRLELPREWLNVV